MDSANGGPEGIGRDVSAPVRSQEFLGDTATAAVPATMPDWQQFECKFILPARCVGGVDVPSECLQVETILASAERWAQAEQRRDPSWDPKPRENGGIFAQRVRL